VVVVAAAAVVSLATSIPSSSSIRGTSSHHPFIRSNYWVVDQCCWLFVDDLTIIERGRLLAAAEVPAGPAPRRGPVAEDSLKWLRDGVKDFSSNVWMMNRVELTEFVASRHGAADDGEKKHVDESAHCLLLWCRDCRVDERRSRLSTKCCRWLGALNEDC
jgi:hypothetical protein